MEDIAARADLPAMFQPPVAQAGFHRDTPRDTPAGVVVRNRDQGFQAEAKPFTLMRLQHDGEQLLLGRVIRIGRRGGRSHPLRAKDDLRDHLSAEQAIQAL